MTNEYIVVVDSFSTGARKYWASDRTVNRRSLARPMIEADARVVADNLKARLGRTAIVSIEPARN